METKIETEVLIESNEIEATPTSNIPKTQEELLVQLRECYKTLSVNEAKEYQKKWRRLSTDWESVYEEEMNDEFYSLIDYSFAGQKEVYKSNYDIKVDLIAQAKHVLTLSDLNTATKLMNSIFDTWKQTKSAGRDKDDELWNTFNEVRNTFYNNKKANYDKQKENREKAKLAKLELIEKAKELADVSEFKASTKEMNELFDLWKKAGSAPREDEDSLWEQFNGYRQQFYDKKKLFVQEQTEKFDASYQKKLKLIEKAKEILDTNKYTKENSDLIVSLNTEWKNAGYCGKKDQETWEEFRTILDKYFAELTNYNTNKKQNWLNKMEDSKKYKLNQIDQEKRTIERIKNDMVGTISEKAISDMKLDIEDIENYIKELEEDIKEIDSKLN